MGGERESHVAASEKGPLTAGGGARRQPPPPSKRGAASQSPHRSAVPDGPKQHGRAEGFCPCLPCILLGRLFDAREAFPCFCHLFSRNFNIIFTKHVNHHPGSSSEYHNTWPPSVFQMLNYRSVCKHRSSGGLPLAPHCPSGALSTFPGPASHGTFKQWHLSQLTLRQLYEHFIETSPTTQLCNL